MNDTETVMANPKEELRKLIADEEVKKREAFEREYTALVEKYGYMIGARPDFLSDGRVVATIGVIARPQQ